jgi:hypothetical protein
MKSKWFRAYWPAVLGLAACVAMALSVYVGIAAGSGPTSPGQGNGPETFTVGLFGDMPYNAQGKADYPYLLQDIACFGGFSARAICDRLPPVATTRLHKGSICRCLNWRRYRLESRYTTIARGRPA